MRLKIVAAVVLLALGLGAVGFALFGPNLTSGQASSQFLTSQAAVTTVTQQAVATGNLAAGATYGLSFGQAPQLVISATSATSSGASGSGASSTTWPVQSVAVKVGDAVKKGGLLASADASAAQLQLTITQSSLSAAQARLAQDQSGSTATDKAAAQLSIDQASQQLANARQSRSDTLDQNNLSVAQAKSTLTQAKGQLATDQAASAPASVIGADQAQVTQAQQAYDNAVVRAATSNHQAADSVAGAQLSLRSAQNAYVSKTTAAPTATIASDQAAVATAQMTLANAQRTVANAVLVAPIDGTVVAVNVVPGFDAGSGYAIELVGAGLVVNAAFAESAVPSLKAGQAATVTISSLGATAQGNVTLVNPVAATSGGSSVVTFDVLVTLNNPPAAARPGMSVSVAVTTAEAANVLAIPAIALVGSAGNYEVRVVDATGQTQLVPVDVGLTTSSLAEIRSGLSAGQSVVVGTSTQRTGTGSAAGLPNILGGGGGRNFGGGGGNGGATRQP